MTNRRLASLLMGLGITTFTVRALVKKYANSGGVVIDPKIKKDLPIAKNLQTIDDKEGNYDIDGVSFDSEGVVVSSDNNKELHVGSSSLH